MALYRRIDQLPAASGAPIGTDLLEGEVDPAGTPASVKWTVDQLAASVAFSSRYSGGGGGGGGADGAPGSVWRAGSGAPSTGAGIIGDWYLNSANGDVYEKTGSSAWTVRANIKGATGSTGSTGATGTTGTAGAAGSTGAAGAAGSVLRSGSGAPSTGAGIVGDWYLNDANGDFYEKTGSSSWTLRDNLTGPAGSGGSGSLETNFPVTLGVALSDETTALSGSTSVPKVKFRLPCAFVLTEVRVGLSVADSAALSTFDVHDGANTTIFGTKPTIDIGEYTTELSAAVWSLARTSFLDDEELSAFIDSTGSVARGAKMWLLGYRDASTTPAIPVGAPSAPATSSLSTGTANQLGVAWTAPLYDNGSTVTGYYVRYRINNSSPSWTQAGPISGLSTNLTGLTGSTQYAVEVQAVNSVGRGPWCSTMTATPTGGTTAPAQVGTVTPTPANASVALAWSAPSNGGVTIDDYLVEYKASASGTWLTFADGNSGTSPEPTGATVTGLTNGTPYDFRVSAINSVGTGTASATVSNTPRTTPGAPTSVAGTPASTSVALTWTAPASTGGSAITNYLIEYKLASSGTWLPWTRTTGTLTTASETVTGLTASSSYDFRVSTINAAGTGTVSSTYTVSTTSAGAAPTVRGFAYREFPSGTGSTTIDPTSTTSASGGFTTKPNGGDLLLLIAVNSNGSKLMTDINAPSGWTLLGGTAGGQSFDFYTKVAGGSAGSPTTDTAYSISAGGNQFQGIYVVLAIAGGAGIDAHSQGSSFGASPHATPSVTTTVANTLLVSFYCASGNGSDSQAFGTTLRNAFFSVGGITYGVATQAISASGATGTKSWATTISGTPSWDALNIAVKS